MKTITQLTYVAFALVCFAVLSTTQAVSPPPDGLYFGANTAEGGVGALFSLTTGTNNTAVGNQALFSLTTGVQNTAVGAQALKNNTVDQNTAIGFQALVNNTVGMINTATGRRALYKNTFGGGNTATGAEALYSNTGGDSNTANGSRALYSNTTGNANTAIGAGALSSNIDADWNTAIGDLALAGNTGFFNTATGGWALGNNSGSDNTAVGFAALRDNTGNGNTALGNGAGLNVTTASNVICIGAEGADVDNSCFIGNIFGASSPEGAGVFINSNGRLGTLTSSRRFKEEIQPMEKASEALFGLKPVAFRYKKDIDPAGTPQFGLLAEDVEKVNSDLIVRDKEGKPYTVRYGAVNAMLLNEFLKEHKKVQEQGVTIAQQRKHFEAAIAQQQKQIEALTAGLQKVSAQLELSSPVPQVVSKNQ